MRRFLTLFAVAALCWEATLRGTPTATPHVTGVAALYKQAFPSASPATIRNAIVNNATTDRLLYSRFF